MIALHVFSGVLWQVMERGGKEVGKGLCQIPQPPGCGFYVSKGGDKIRKEIREKGKELRIVRMKS